MFADGELNFIYHELWKCNAVCTVLKWLHIIGIIIEDKVYNGITGGRDEL